MCQGGNCRSVGLKNLLGSTVRPRPDVLACGWQWNSPETREMLYDWADIIIVMEAYMAKHVPEKHHFNSNGLRKLLCFDVGPDVWSNTLGGATHPELTAKLIELCRSSGLFVPIDSIPANEVA
jgi:hypothetical protein